MLAAELARHYPTVSLGTDALEAARILADARLPGLIVLDDDGQPYTVLPGSQVLRFIVPGYVQEDPSLARVYDERGGAEACVSKLDGHTVKELLPPKEKRYELPRVSGDATVIECAAMMARLRTPLLLVSDEDTIHGVITASHLLDVILSASGSPA